MAIENPFLHIHRSEEYSHPYEHEKADFPYIIDIEATNICNLDCLMCARQVMKRTLGKIGFELFKKIADEASAEGCKGLRFIRFGEPLLHEKIFEMIAYAKKKGLLTHMTTNGLKLDREKIKKILDSGLDSIIFSFQGTDEKEYSRMRNNAGYGLLEKNIKALAKERGNREKPFIQVTTTVLDETDEQVKGFYKKWERIADRADSWYTSLEMLEGVKRAEPLFKRQKVKEKLPGWEKQTGREWRCNEIMVKLSINWDGTATACCGDFDNFLKVGDAKKESLKKIWHGKKIEKLRKILSKGERQKIAFCSKCTSKF